MYDYYFPLISSCLDGVITAVDGIPLPTPKTIQEYADDTTDVVIDDEGGSEWPNLIFRDRASAPVILASGLVLTGIIAGSHPAIPPHRPK